jgi:hypothetical protein
MEELKGKYIGLKKIKKTDMADRKTYMGSEVLDIEYEDGKKVQIPKEVAIKLATEKAMDLTSLRDKFVEPVISRLIVILLESEIEIDMIDYALQKLAQSVNQRIEKASEMLWGKPLHERNIVDVHLVLTKNNGEPKREERRNNGSRPK